MKLKNFIIFVKKKIKFLISNYFDIAIKCNLDGFYIPSFNNKFYVKKVSLKIFLIVGSAHNIKEIKLKERQNVKLIFLSHYLKQRKMIII